MQAVVCTRYGSPDVLQLQEVAKPAPQDNELLVKVRATTVTAGDGRMRAFNVPPAFWLMGKLALGFTKPRRDILGMELAGEVEAVGKDVKRFRVGDHIIAGMGHNVGGYAEYACLPESDKIVIKPANLTFEEAATIPVGGLTALDFLREAEISSGQSVLVYGASGSVGTYAVQLAKYFGAEVTAVCSAANFELVKSLGADHVIDYTREDFSQNGQTYDIVFEAVGKTTFAQCRNALKKDGVLLHVVMVFAEIKSPWYALTTGTKVVGGNPKGRHDALDYLVRLIEAGEIKPVIDRCYPLQQIVEAHRYLDTGRKKGNVAITVSTANDDQQTAERSATTAHA